MKLRHTPISLQAGEAWLAGDLFHAPNVRALTLLLAAGGNEEEAADDSAPAAATAALVARLQAAGFASLQLNLLSAHEIASGGDAAFDVPRLARRLDLALAWLAHQPQLGSLRIAIIASGTASAAAIRCLAASADAETASRPPFALVVWSGRADLAGAAPLRALRTPTRFVLAEGDPGEDIARRAFGLIEARLADWFTASGSEAKADADAMLDWLERQLASASAG